MTPTDKTSITQEEFDKLEENVLMLEIENHDLKQKIQHYEFEQYKLQEIQRLAKVGTWELNHLSYDLRISSELSQLLYSKTTDMSGLSWHDFLDTFVSAENKDIKKELIEDVIQNGKSLDFEHYIVRLDGKRIFVHHHCKTFYNAIGQPLITTGLIHDFTFEYNQSIELEKRASTDALTLLLNRRRINEVLKEQYEIFQRYQKISAYIMLDIDYFKNVNDLFGHQTGDEVLCKIANIIKSKIRCVDYAGRWGGEEFLIICPNTSLENTFQLAEKLRLNFMEMKNPTGATITASFGVGEIAPGESTDKLLKRIDDALYQAKENGRNQIRFARSAPKS
ncbi:hypothetical protein CXF72_08555 [Psychromonas sp. MB-3u-54]|uniref:GGDEF domain-containing protein n=1 Tax=Psychromonas sp. MB-3u-54 TaxID=2058319 RepID=UPI000C348AD3|nr:GGDEF domain-containing protein [Psychromonas sp. MB-3u-54]PKH03049.1 hypothetical protein CXF72_08555 [Psychromonas sp. MB-3u-54]